ncbi:FAD-containing oxidoreductase [Devosia sp. PTR5]|uniref:FAD-containing oxidoreductase n=1 Tax=Devosia oryzisoli TaxID=2774138 RepID=A0A927FTC8_9HYPH|nr:FAD-containing oxidoreductase [Devosia oryzisoli]MBD8065037.1 FAD-containing oxidoreductase [Devosia oryzisoli]
MIETFDAIIIGGGQAGPALAARLAGAGQKVVLIERHLLGGTCVNTGCTPTKAMVASAHVAHMARRADDYGVSVDGLVSVDMRRVRVRKDHIVEASRDGLKSWLEGTDGVDLLFGHARFVSDHEIAVGERRLTAPKIFINVGGRARIPDLPGLDQITPLTNSSILELDQAPDHLIILGGGYIALEFAQMFRRFGSAVTVIEHGDRLLKREDEDASEVVTELLAGEGVVFRLGTEAASVAKTDEGVGVTLKSGEMIAGTHLLVAVGRVPNTDDLGLEATGISTDKHGYIVTNPRLETDVEGVWALGECNGRGAFTHTSYNDYEIVADNLLGGASRSTKDRQTAYALYTDPPMGRAGMSVADAQAAGHAVLVGKRPMTRVSRATEKGETTGFMKVVVDANTDAILGATIFGVGGDEVVHVLLDAIQAGTTATALRQTMHIHPTVAELVPTILGELEPA